MTGKTKVLACIVSFRNPQRLQRSLTSLKATQLEEDTTLDILVLDNSADSEYSSEVLKVCNQFGEDPVGMDENRGVAGAHHYAMSLVLEQGYDFLWLWDQDSSAPPQCLTQLLKSFRKDREQQATDRRDTRVPIGIVGPKLIDPGESDEFFAFFNEPFDLSLMYHRCFPMAWIESGEVRTNYLLSSGSLISRDVIERVGGTDVSYFMDTVDFEYCSRAVDAGFRLLINADTWFHHRVGDPIPRKFRNRRLFGRGYPPFRYYYQARNDLLLAGAQENLGIRLRMAWVVFVRGGRIVLTERPVYRRLAAHYLGLIHGLLGRRGRVSATWIKSA